MTDTGLENFDRTLEETHRWMNDVGEGIGPDRQRQFHALRAVFWTLRDRLTPDEAFHLSSHLPHLLRGIFWEGYDPAGKPEGYRDRASFVARVAKALAGAAPIAPDEATRAVLGAISRRVPEGEVDHVRRVLPDALGDLFPDR